MQTQEVVLTGLGSLSIGIFDSKSLFKRKLPRPHELGVWLEVCVLLEVKFEGSVILVGILVSAIRRPVLPYSEMCSEYPALISTRLWRTDLDVWEKRAVVKSRPRILDTN